jgi:hypothetical protein
MILITAAGFCSLLSFGLGYFGFKIRTTWCPEHGATLRCPECSTSTGRRPQAAGR